MMCSVWSIISISSLKSQFTMTFVNALSKVPYGLHKHKLLYSNPNYSQITVILYSSQ